MSVASGTGPSQADVRARVQEAVRALPTIVDEVMARSGIPGVAVAVVHEGAMRYGAGFGRRSLDDPHEERVDIDTAFQLASVSKPIAATVIAALVHRGEVGWDSRISDLMPGFDLGDEFVTRHVTVGDLLAHRSGLPHAAGDDLEDIGYRWPDILNRIGMLDPHPFRAQHAYSNFGFTAAAQAVAHAVGVEWEELAEREVFRPLRMASGSYRAADFHARTNRAALHARIDGRWSAAFTRDPDQQAAAGGASASVRDIARWMRLLLGRGTVDDLSLFGEDALLPALTPQSLAKPPRTVEATPRHYGYGFNIVTSDGGRMSFGHSGGFVLGAGTVFRVIPDLDLGIAVLTNAAPIGGAEAIASSVQDIVEVGRITRDWYPAYAGLFAPLTDATGDLVGRTPARTAPTVDLAPYTGEYQDAYFGPAHVVQSHGRLCVQLGPARSYRLDLRPWGEDVFAFVPHGENAPDGSLSTASFQWQGDRVDRMRLEFFASNGRGTWTR